MCEFCATAAERSLIARRGLLQFAAFAAAGLAITPHALAAPIKAPPKPANVLSPDAAFDRLMKGNGRYVEGVSMRHDFRHEREALSQGQNPYAAVLSCADSRIAPEYCFDAARGDLFVCRVAGNFATEEIIASLEYGGAGVEYAVDHGARPRRLRRRRCHHQVDQGRHNAARSFAVSRACADAGGRGGTRAARRPAHERDPRQCRLTVDKLKTASPILKSFVDDKKIRVVGGVYELRLGTSSF